MSNETDLPQEKNVVRLSSHKKEPQVKNTHKDVDDILKECIGKLSGVIVLGYTAGEEDDQLEYFVHSFEDCAEMVWLLERFKIFLLSEADAL